MPTGGITSPVWSSFGGVMTALNEQSLAKKFALAESLNRGLCFSPGELTVDEVIGKDPKLSELQLATFESLLPLTNIAPSLSSHERIIAIGLLSNGLYRISKDQSVNNQALELLHSLLSTQIRDQKSYSPSILPILELLDKEGTIHLKELYMLERNMRGDICIQPISDTQMRIIGALCRVGNEGFLSAVELLDQDSEGLDLCFCIRDLANVFIKNVESSVLHSWSRKTFDPSSGAPSTALAAQIIKVHCDEILPIHVADMKAEIEACKNGLSPARVRYHLGVLYQPARETVFYREEGSPSARAIDAMNQGLAILLQDEIAKLNYKRVSNEIIVPPRTRNGIEDEGKKIGTGQIRRLLSRIFKRDVVETDIESAPASILSSNQADVASERKTIDIGQETVQLFCRTLLKNFYAHPLFKEETVHSYITPDVAEEVSAKSSKYLIENWIPLIEQVREIDSRKLTDYSSKEALSSSLGFSLHILPSTLELLKGYSLSNDPWKREIALSAYLSAHRIADRNAIGAIPLPYDYIQTRCKELLTDQDSDVNARASELFFILLNDLSSDSSNQKIDTEEVFNLEIPDLDRSSRWVYVIRNAAKHLVLDEVRGLKAANLCLKYNDEFLHREVLEWFLEYHEKHQERFIPESCERVFREMLARDAAGTGKLHYSTRDDLNILLDKYTVRGA